MSNLIGKAVSKLLVVIIAVALVLEFRTAILTDKDLSAAFGGLMGALPFAGMARFTLTVTPSPIGITAVSSPSVCFST